MSFFDTEALEGSDPPLQLAASGEASQTVGPPTLEDRLAHSNEVIERLEREVLDLDKCDSTATCCHVPLSLQSGRSDEGIRKEEEIYREIWTHLDETEFQSELVLGGGGGGMFGPSSAMCFLCRHFHYLMRMSCSVEPVFPGIRLPVVPEEGAKSAEPEDRKSPSQTPDRSLNLSPVASSPASGNSPLQTEDDPLAPPRLEDVMEISHAAALKVLQAQQSSEWVAQLVRKLDHGEGHRMPNQAPKENEGSPTQDPASPGPRCPLRVPETKHVDPMGDVSTRTPEASSSSEATEEHQATPLGKDSPPPPGQGEIPLPPPLPPGKRGFLPMEQQQDDNVPGHKKQKKQTAVGIAQDSVEDVDHMPYDPRLDEVWGKKTISLRALKAKNEHSIFAATLSAVCDSDEGSANLLEQAIGFLVLLLKPCPSQRSELTACFETLMTKHKVVASTKFPTVFRNCLEVLHKDPQSSRWILVGFVEELYSICVATAPPPALKGKNLTMCCTKLFGGNNWGGVDGSSMATPSTTTVTNSSVSTNPTNVSSPNTLTTGGGGGGFWSNHSEYSVLGRLLSLLYSEGDIDGEEDSTREGKVVFSEDREGKLDALKKAQAQLTKLLLEYSKPCRHWEGTVKADDYPTELKKRSKENDLAAGGSEEADGADNDPMSVMMQQQMKRALNFPVDPLRDVLYRPPVVGGQEEIERRTVSPTPSATRSTATSPIPSGEVAADIVFPWIKEQLSRKGAERKPSASAVTAIELLRSLSAWALGELSQTKDPQLSLWKEDAAEVLHAERLVADIGASLTLVCGCLEATLEPPYNGAGLTVICQSVLNLVETLEPATLRHASGPEGEQTSPFSVLAVGSSWWKALGLDEGILPLLSDGSKNLVRSSSIAATSSAFASVFRMVSTRSKTTEWVPDTAREQSLGPKTQRTGMSLIGVKQPGFSGTHRAVSLSSNNSSSGSSHKSFMSVEEVESSTKHLGLESEALTLGLFKSMGQISTSTRVTMCFKEDPHASSQLSFCSNSSSGSIGVGNNAPNVHPVPWLTMEEIEASPLVPFTGIGRSDTPTERESKKEKRRSPNGSSPVIDLFAVGGSPAAPTQSSKTGSSNSPSSSKSSSRSPSTTSSATSIDLFATPPTSPYEAIAQGGQMVDLFAAYGGV